MGLQALPVANAAQDNTLQSCEKKLDNNLEYSQCLDRVKEATDRELQTWVNNQIFLLEEFATRTGRNSALVMFERSQRNFITFRENNCRWQFLVNAPSVKASSAYKKCYIFISKNRINELNIINKSSS